MQQETGLLSPRVGLCDIRDPERMAESVLRSLAPDPERAIPVEDIARTPDIHEIRCERLTGFEGLLLTDRVRSVGSILVNNAHGNETRIRFTIAHELGHFLLEHHQPTSADGFACKAGDMSAEMPENGAQNGDRQHQRQEGEANLFAISLLAPKTRLTGLLKGDPDLQTVHALATRLQISRQAALRRFIALYPRPMAFAVAHDGRIMAAHRHPRFPWLLHVKGTSLPIGPELSGSAGEHGPWQAASPGTWCDAHHGPLLQQVHVSKRGFITILLGMPDQGMPVSGR